MKEHGFYAAGLKDVVLSDDIEIYDDEEEAKMRNLSSPIHRN